MSVSDALLRLISVHMHGANGYIVHQFIDSSSKKRIDSYGGSVANRTRFVLEILAALQEVYGPDVSIKLSPTRGTTTWAPSPGDRETPCSPLLRRSDAVQPLHGRRVRPQIAGDEARCTRDIQGIPRERKDCHLPELGGREKVTMKSVVGWRHARLDVSSLGLKDYCVTASHSQARTSAFDRHPAPHSTPTTASVELALLTSLSLSLLVYASLSSNGGSSQAEAIHLAFGGEEEKLRLVIVRAKFAETVWTGPFGSCWRVLLESSPTTTTSKLAA
ncbi:hypothetical protein C8F01DRAFT_1269463 [Mycena amicta]|nr:hypothetical protein C8F01DRAFT_1269463 [Mycena amicta]